MHGTNQTLSSTIQYFRDYFNSALAGYFALDYPHPLVAPNCISIQFSAQGSSPAIAGPAAAQFPSYEYHGSDKWNKIYGTSGSDATGTYPLFDVAGYPTEVTLEVDGGLADPTYTYTQFPAIDASNGLLYGGLTGNDYDDIWLLLQNVPAGTYDLYVYGTGGTNDFGFGTQTWNSNFEIYNYGCNPQVTTCSTGWDINTWVEGNQYVVFRGIHTEGGVWYLQVQPETSCSPYTTPLINGLQLVRTGP